MPYIPPPFNISAGATSNYLGSVTFSNSNGVSFGLNGSTITASVSPGGGGLTNINVSAGTTSNNLSNVTFADGNGVSFGLNASTITATVKTDYLTTAALSGDTTKYVQAWQLTGNTAGTTSSLQGTKIYFSGGNSLTVSGSSNTIVLSVGNYLTTAALSQDSSKYAGTGFTSAGNNIGLSGTLNTAGLSLSATVAAQSNQSAIKGFGVSNTGQTAGNTGISTGIDWVMAGSNSITLSQSTAAGGPNTIWVQHPAWITTADLSQNSSKYAGTGFTSAGSNIGLSGTLNTAGLSLSATVPDMLSLGVSTGGNTAGSTGMVSNRLVFVGSNGITLSQSTGGASSATITISGDGYTLSSYDPWPWAVGTNVVLLGKSTDCAVPLWQFDVPCFVSAGAMQFAYSMDFSTVGAASGRESGGMQFAIYTRNVSTLSSLVSTSFSWGITGNNSTYSISQITKTNFTGYDTPAQTTSAGVNITSNYTGFKIIQVPVNTLLTPGHYWLATLYTASTSSNNVGLVISRMGNQEGIYARWAFAPIGSTASWTTGINFSGFGGWYPGGGVISSNVANLPANINFSDISASGTANPMSNRPAMRFFST